LAVGVGAGHGSRVAGRPTGGQPSG
jgi:hypothetical protein